MEEDDLKINHHRDGVPLEPVYKESGNDAIDGDEADYLYKPKKRKKKKRSLKDYHKSPLNEPMKETPFDSHTSLKRIDYVLVYENKEIETLDKKERKKFEKNEKLRERFEQVLVNQEHLQIEKERVGEVTFLKIHCPFPRMSQEAESVHLEMPLREGAIPDDETHGSCYNYFVTDNEQDYVSASYETAKRHVFKGFEDPETFFRPALRSYLVNHMLINLDITENTDEKDEDTLRRKGLPYLLMKEAYTDAFILHDESPYEYYKRKKDAGEEVPTKEEFEKHAKAENIEDPRKELNDTWCRFTKFQPLWKIRNYFGEKIAFYFAWSGTLITTLWIPTLLGVAITLYGLYLSVEEYEAQKNQVFNSTANVTFNNTVGTTPASVVGELKNLGMDIYSIIKQSFDNSVTPYFSIVICLWGTLFLEIWKRTNARLAYEWDVDNYEFNEIDRPQFYGTKERVDPVSELPDWYYPFYRQFVKFMMSCSIMVFMVCLVIASAIGVIVYRVVSRVDYSNNPMEEFVYSTLLSSVLNSVSIMIMGKIYEILAYKLTDWENHRTQTSYDDALIIKLFAFQFVNSYVSLYYIAFFRDDSTKEHTLLETSNDGILDFGPEYEDTCDNNDCMSMLSFQVLVLMLLKPLPKFFKDIILPWFIKNVKKCLRKCKNNKVDEAEKPDDSTKVEMNDFLERERQKPPVGDVSRSPPVGDFTLMEYNEKIIQYGYLMLFACSLPLAPLIALLTNLCDIRVDAKRLLWFNRRPVALVAQDIGMWYGILEFMNMAGVVTNAFLIAFTSSWGRENLSMVNKLWYVIGFEHCVFAIKFLIAYMIPDVPTDVSLSMRREKYQVTKILETAGLMPLEEGAPMITSATAHLVGGYSMHQIGLTGAGVPAIHPYEKRRESLSFSSPTKSSSIGIDRDIARLSYGMDGATYIDPEVDDKFPDPENKSKRRRRKKKHHQDSDLDYHPKDNELYPEQEFEDPKV